LRKSRALRGELWVNVPEHTKVRRVQVAHEPRQVVVRAVRVPHGRAPTGVEIGLELIVHPHRADTEFFIPQALRLTRDALRAAKRRLPDAQTPRRWQRWPAH